MTGALIIRRKEGQWHQFYIKRMLKTRNSLVMLSDLICHSFL